MGSLREQTGLSVIFLELMWIIGSVIGTSTSIYVNLLWTTWFRNQFSRLLSLLTDTLVLEEIFYLLFLQITTFLAIPGYPGWSGREKYFRWCGTQWLLPRRASHFIRTSTDKMFPFRSVKKSWFTEISCVMLFQEDNLQINFARSGLVLSRLCRSSPRRRWSWNYLLNARLILYSTSPRWSIIIGTRSLEVFSLRRLQSLIWMVTLDILWTRFSIIGNGLEDARVRQYLVKWLGYQHPTREPEVNLKDESGQEIVQLKDYLREINWDSCTLLHFSVG